MKVKNRVILLAGAVITVAAMVVGCGNGLKSEAQQAVEKQLLDPDSAKFSEVRVYDTEVVCGNVNAKNRMGGYTGSTAFIYNGRTAKNVELDVKQYELDEWCTDVKPTIELLEKLCTLVSSNKTPESDETAKKTCANRDSYMQSRGYRLGGKR